MESEIKAKVEDIELIRCNLKKINAKFLNKFSQKDTYVSPPNMNFAGTLKYYLRVRSGKKNSFDYHIVEDNINTREYEVKIENPENMLKILIKLGFKIDCIVEKTREEFKIENFTVVIDDVKGLGNFVEIESEKEKGLFEMAEKIGIKKSMIVSGKGYPDMIMENER